MVTVAASEKPEEERQRRTEELEIDPLGVKRFDPLFAVPLNQVQVKPVLTIETFKKRKMSPAAKENAERLQELAAAERAKEATAKQNANRLQELTAVEQAKSGTAKLFESFMRFTSKLL